MKHRNFLSLRLGVFVTFVFVVLILWSNGWASYQTGTSDKSVLEGYEQEEKTNQTDNSEKNKQEQERKQKQESEIGNHEKFVGLGFGWGLSVAFGGKEKVESAELVNGVVRVSKSVNVDPRLVLETHFLFGLKKYKTNGTKKVKEYAEMTNLDIGGGPFICVLVSGDELIEAFGGGIMVGVRKKGAENSFNIGIGFINDTEYKVLGDDIEANKSLPNGETEIRYKTKNQWRLQIVFAFRF